MKYGVDRMARHARLSFGERMIRQWSDVKQAAYGNQTKQIPRLSIYRPLTFRKTFYQIKTNSKAKVSIGR